MGDSSEEEKEGPNELVGGLYRYIKGFFATLDRAGVTLSDVTNRDGAIEIDVTFKVRLTDPRKNP